MKRIFLKSTAVAFSSLLASLLIAASLVPALGEVDANAWRLLIICSLAIAWPVSAYTSWQGEKLRNAHRDLARTHAELAAAHRRLEEKASRDPMTGMLNRENFFAALDGSRRKTDRGALLIIDADHFKKINDSYGHLTGDKALLAIAAAISSGVRAGDLLGRIGGEEFAAFLVGASDEEAIGVAERVRIEVEAIRFQPVDGRDLPLTVSIGGTPCKPDANVSELMRAADKRLYEAKGRGRNRTIYADGMPAAA